VFRYHDTFPRPDWAPPWPELLPSPGREELEAMAAGGLVLGTPDDALETCRKWEAAGADQLVFGVGMTTQEQMLKTIRLMGEHVIPKIDKDPVHRTTRLREAVAKVTP